MKKILRNILAMSAIPLLMLSACKKDGKLVVANGGKAGALTASTTTLALNKADSSNNALTLNFTQADYGYAAGVTNTLQIDTAGDNWANPYNTVLGTKVFTQSYTTGAFNKLVLGMGVKAGKAVQLS